MFSESDTEFGGGNLYDKPVFSNFRYKIEFSFQELTHYGFTGQNTLLSLESYEKKQGQI